MTPWYTQRLEISELPNGLIDVLVGEVLVDRGVVLELRQVLERDGSVVPVGSRSPPR